MFNSSENNAVNQINDHIMKKLKKEDDKLPIQCVNFGKSPLKIDLTSTNNIIVSKIVDKEFELFLQNNQLQSHRFKLTEN